MEAIANDLGKIEAWVNSRFGVPNTFNRQLLYDFLMFATKELGYHKLPEPDEIKEWISESFNRLNPEYVPFLLMGVEALYTHLGGERFIEVKMPKRN